MNSKLKSIYLGQAIGDALGLATEFMTKKLPQMIYSYKTTN
tara:strand:- start:392 stop:514 length:123 start_codon:yes stop_codon:yes gene_type:complete